MEYVRLNNGLQMPAEGLGTFMLSPADAEEAVYSALKTGYRMIDTANAYMNERAVGRGMKRSGVKRGDIFLVTKLWPTEYGTAADAIERTLERLGTDYVDMLILHQPVGDCKAAYKAMEEAYKAGRVRSLGLSNFPEDMMREFADDAEIVPQIVQVEAHPYFPQTELKKTLSKYGIALMAWYPLGHGDRSLIGQKVFSDLAAKYGKSNAQIILRWHVQTGHIVIPGSKNPEHIASNFDIFDFALTADEMKSIAKLDRNKRYYNMSLKDAAKAYLSLDIDFDDQP